MLKKQRPEWDSSDKASRRQLVAQTHQIVLLVGDDMGDFAGGQGGGAARRHARRQTARAMTQLGKRWFVIPEPDVWLVGKAVPKDALGAPGRAAGARRGW